MSRKESVNTALTFRLVLATVLSFIASSAPVLCSADEAAAPQRAILGGMGARGVFDPSVTEDPATRRLWMSYSSFDASTHSRFGVSLRLAYSDDGEKWHDAGAVQKFSEVLAGPLQATEAGELEVGSE